MQANLFYFYGCNAGHPAISLENLVDKFESQSKISFVSNKVSFVDQSNIMAECIIFPLVLFSIKNGKGSTQCSGHYRKMIFIFKKFPFHI